MDFADRVLQVSSSQTQAVTAAAAKLRKKGVDVIDLGAGEPDFRTPAHIGDAAITAVREGFTKYTLNSGTEELRRAICSWYEQRYGVSFPMAQCMVCAGGKQGLFNAAMCLFRQGDEVVTHSPVWPAIVEQIKLIDATPVRVRTSAETAFKVDAKSILDAVTDNTRAIILNSPSNPTGAVISEIEVETIAKETQGTGIWLVLDLCYEQLIYSDDGHNLPLLLSTYAPERSVLIGSASKSYAMTGWRCGWILGPESLISHGNSVQSHATSNVSSITQKAALAALTGGDSDVIAMCGEYKDRRDLLIDALKTEPRYRIVTPGGAFYLFPDITDFLSIDGLRTSAEFSTRLLQEAHVAVTPGEAFDAPGYLRLSFAASKTKLLEASERLLAFASKVN